MLLQIRKFTEIELTVSGFFDDLKLKPFLINFAVHPGDKRC